MELDTKAVVKRALKNNETRRVLARELWKHTPFYGDVEKVVFRDSKEGPIVHDCEDGYVRVHKLEHSKDGYYVQLIENITYDDVVRFCPFILNKEEAVSRSLRQISCYLEDLKYVISNEQIKALARMAEEELSVVERYIKNNQKED